MGSHILTILIAPTAFKGSLAPLQAADAIAAGLARSRLQATWERLPLADGGDGTLDAFLATGGRRVEVETVDALMRPCTAAMGLLEDGTAVVEMALASGLARLTLAERSALRASSFGTGLLMRAALETGARRIVVGLGGSATTDGGAGALEALGTRFLDARGERVSAVGGSLNRIASIDTRGIDSRWREIDLILATDVRNPALGPQGAAAVYAPQKGASLDEVKLLETGLAHFFSLVAQHLHVDVRATPGGGAAGAMAAGLMAFLGGHIETGVDLILDHHRFEERLDGADLVITGEGRMDGQTLEGKAPLGLARRAAARGVRTVALVGALGAEDELLHEQGVWAVLPIVSEPMPLDAAVANASRLLEQAAARLGYLLQI